MRVPGRERLRGGGSRRFGWFRSAGLLGQHHSKPQSQHGASPGHAFHSTSPAARAVLVTWSHPRGARCATGERTPSYAQPVGKAPSRHRIQPRLAIHPGRVRSGVPAHVSAVRGSHPQPRGLWPGPCVGIQEQLHRPVGFRRIHAVDRCRRLMGVLGGPPHLACLWSGEARMRTTPPAQDARPDPSWCLLVL